MLTSHILQASVAGGLALITGLSLRTGWAFELLLVLHHCTAIVVLPGIWFHLRSLPIVLKAFLGTSIGLQVASILLDVSWPVFHRHPWTSSWTHVTVSPIGRIVSTADSKSSRHSYSNPSEKRPTLTMVLQLEMPPEWTIRPGQYILLWIRGPSWRSLWQRHPFFIILRSAHQAEWAKASFPAWKITKPELVAYIQPRCGLTERLRSRLGNSCGSYRALVSGPFGHSHSLDNIHTVVMLTAGHRIVSMLPYLSDIIHNDRPSRPCRIYLVWQLDKEGEYIPLLVKSAVTARS